MDKELKNEATKEIDGRLTVVKTQRKLEKEHKFESLIVRIIVKATLKEYYEKSNKIP